MQSERPTGATREVGGETPRADDSLHQPASQRVPLQKSPAAALVDGVMTAANQAGQEAESRYQDALRALRELPGEVVVELARRENVCEPLDYTSRWMMVYIAGQLRHRAAIPFLRNVILTPVPPERPTDTHRLTIAAQETVLRTTAIEGLGYLVESKDQEALEALFEALKLPLPSIRRAAVQCLLRVKGKELRKRILDYLPPEQRFLLDLKPGDVQQIAQVPTPQRDLKDHVEKPEKVAAPEIPHDPKRPERRSPKARKKK